MLQQIDLNKKMSKKEKKSYMDAFLPELGRLQREIRAANIPVMLVFEGFGASGKGYQIARLIEALDPRGFVVHAVGRETEDEKAHPFLWRFWTKLPAKGQIGIFDRSWYRKVLLDRFDKKTEEAEIGAAYHEINSFERQLTADGTILIKLFLCIDKKEQRKRFERLMKSKATAWRVTRDDLRRNEEFAAYKKMNDEMLEETDTSYVPWNLIESMDREYATVKIYKTVIEALQDALIAQAERKKAEQAAGAAAKAEIKAKKAPEKETESVLKPEKTAAAKLQSDDAESAAHSSLQSGMQEAAEQSNEAQLMEDADRKMRLSSLNRVDLSLSLAPAFYKRRLKELQNRLEELQGECYRKHIPVVIGFEGWDAGGKGGAIKRLTEQLDPRGYRVNPTAAPNDEEKQYHYLWRFWRNMPKDGHIAVFDRTWYGRVMVERIEHFCTQDEWQRAYSEINEMEKQLVRHGAVVLKFWMQISKDEQARRFKERMDDPDKRWKITDEDWRNREKWDLYEKAVDEMLVRTSTLYAPWTIVEGNDKYYARIKVLETTAAALEQRLKHAPKRKIE